MSLFNKLRNRFHWLIVELAWMFYIPQKISSDVEFNFCIGISTFKDRYKKFLKPLVRKLSWIFPDVPLIIAVNGHHDQILQSKYLKKIRLWSEQFSTIRLLEFNEPQGLSKLWNQIIIHSSKEKILLLNDDVKISKSLQYEILQGPIKGSDLAVINRSWSHFLISKSIIRLVGWFDERLKQIGGEDDDYLVRLYSKGITPDHIRLNSIRNLSHVPKDPSYGRNMRTQVNLHYSQDNLEFLHRKYIINKCPTEGAIYTDRGGGLYFTLKKGMQTPDFYPDLII